MILDIQRYKRHTMKFACSTMTDTVQIMPTMDATGITTLRKILVKTRLKVVRNEVIREESKRTD